MSALCQKRTSGRQEVCSLHGIGTRYIGGSEEFFRDEILSFCSALAVSLSSIFDQNQRTQSAEMLCSSAIVVCYARSDPHFPRHCGVCYHVGARSKHSTRAGYGSCGLQPPGDASRRRATSEAA